MPLTQEQRRTACTICDEILTLLAQRKRQDPEPAQQVLLKLTELQQTVEAATPAEFARCSAVPWPTVSRWFAGGSVPQRHQIVGLRKLIESGNWGASSAKQLLSLYTWSDIARLSEEPIQRIWLFSWDPFLDDEDQQVFKATSAFIRNSQVTFCYVFCPNSPADESFQRLARKLKNQTAAETVPGRVVGFRLHSFRIAKPLFSIGIRYAIWEGEIAPDSANRMGVIFKGGLAFCSPEKYEAIIDKAYPNAEEPPLIWMEEMNLAKESRHSWEKYCCEPLALELYAAEVQGVIKPQGVHLEPIDID